VRVFENRVPRIIFGPKRDEVTGGWRKLHNEELRNLYSYIDQVKKDEMGRACSTNGEEEECLSDIEGKARRKESTTDQEVGGWIILKWILQR
jgi:hypothetical protein